jgi:hypothetical protein
VWTEVLNKTVTNSVNIFYFFCHSRLSKNHLQAKYLAVYSTMSEYVEGSLLT